ncbi:rod shape-determining protein MreC [Hydrogenovibrio halophilus]|uniref:rod shape-determining protein MreC n=1 Tax=Hydrogenovibrio halophilus TaxID=373391 RepID=UPI002480EC2B|nr:rod shape-determining protein MreC [Hydrogenovibrio halophilus]
MLSIALMVADHYSQALTHFRSLLLTTIDPIERTAALPGEWYDWFQQDYQTLNQVKLENQRLKTEVLLLKAQQQQLSKLKLDVERLNRLLGKASQMDDTQVQIASVSFYSQTPYSHFYTLNKGQLDQVALNQTVIDAKGVVGQITSTTPVSSRVRLITDPEIQVPVRVQRNGQRGMLSGMGHDRLTLLFIPDGAAIQKGDLLETSGLGLVYPEGYPIARVTQVNRMEGRPYLDVQAEPVAELNRSQKVLILTQSAQPREAEHAN